MNNNCLLSLICMLCLIGYAHCINFALGKCVTLPTGTFSRLENPCVGVVNYPFYLFPTVTLEMLERQASTKLNSTSLPQISSECTSRIVRYVCSQIYLRCQPNIDFTNTQTYNYAIYRTDSSTDVALPYQRPCRSVCTEVLQNCYLNPTLYMLNPQPDCNARYDYSKGSSLATLPFRFDSSNNQSRCYIPALRPLSTATSTYSTSKSTAVCKPYVKDFIVPPAPRLNSSWTLLQPPGVIQEIIDQQLSIGFSKLSEFIPRDCLISIQQYICYSTYLKPQQQTLDQALVYTLTQTQKLSTLPIVRNNINSQNPNILKQVLNLPKYPHESVCVNFLRKCGTIAPRIAEANPTLISLNCTRTVSGSIRAFPTANQTVASVQALTLTLQLSSSPYQNVYVNESQISYQPSCPTGFVIPEDPTRKEVAWIAGSACAMSCKVLSKFALNRLYFDH
jgi:hypothetical protein